MSKNKISVLNSILITWISQTSSKFLPTGNLTGEFVRFYLAKKTGQNFSEASSSVLMDLFIATFSLLIVGLLTFVFIIIKKRKHPCTQIGGSSCAKDPKCFDANYECTGCCSTGLAKNGANCWDEKYTTKRCCV